jgi:phage protein D
MDKLKLSHTDEAIERMHAHMVAQRKTKGKQPATYHEARAAYFEAVCQNARDQRDHLEAQIAAGRGPLEQAMQEARDEAIEERDEAQKALAELQGIEAEFTALREALGLSAMDWDSAVQVGQLPTGQFLKLNT